MLNQIELIAAICGELEEQGSPPACPRQYNAVIRAANIIIEECGRAPVMASPEMGFDAWLASDDTGDSSRYLASVLRGFDCEYAHPHDLDDFGRCSRLLLAVPEFRRKLELIRGKSWQWANILDVWSKLESLMNDGNHKEANRIVMDAVKEPCNAPTQ